MDNSDDITSVADFVNKVQNLYKQKRLQRHLFFRGHSKETYQLLPSVFRPPYTHNLHTEKDIILDIKQYAPEHNISYSVKELDKVLCEMQHNEIPTRLLDWTVSPLVALYFACESRHEDNGKIWVFNPWEYNKEVLKKSKYPTSQIHDIHVMARSLLGLEWTQKEIKSFIRREYGLTKSVDMTLPWAFVAPFTNKRKVFQRGVFLIFGKNQLPFETYSIAQPYLSCYTIPKAYKKKIIQELNNLYINDYTVYPDYRGMKNVFKKYSGLFNSVPFK